MYYYRYSIGYYFRCYLANEVISFLFNVLESSLFSKFNNWTLDPKNYSEFGPSNLFFFFNNVKILLIIEKVPNRVHWGCTMGAQIMNQKYNGQEK